MNFEELKGQTLTAIDVDKGNAQINFTTDAGKIFKMYHSQDCCESVDIEDISGDIADLFGSPLLQAEEASSSDTWPEGVKKEYEPESYTWTFYKLATIKGSVTIRWYGSSNGYYSESVSFAEAV